MRTDLVGIEKRWDTFERYFNMKLAERLTCANGAADGWAF